MSPLVIAFATIVAPILIYWLFKLIIITGPSLPLPPGPRPWPIVGNLPHVGRMPHQTFAALAQSYGPLMYFRLGYIDTVVAASAAAAEQFLKVHDANFSSRPQSSTFRHLFDNVKDFAGAPYGPRFRLIRKISVAHMFSGKALEGFRQVREEEVKKLTCNLANSGSKAVKLGQLVNVCTTNSLARVMIGRRVFNDDNSNYDPRWEKFKSIVKELMEEVKKLTCNLANSGSKAVKLGQLVNVCTTNSLARVMIGRRVFNDDNSNYDPRAEEFKSIVKELMVLLGIFNISDFIPALDWLDLQGVKPKANKLRKRFDAFLTSILEEHKMSKNTENHQDLYLSTLLSLSETSQEGIKLTEAEIKLIILNMFGAGTDTPSSTIEWAIAELIKNPTIMGKVQQELDTIIGRDRLVTELDLPQLTYLQAVMKETLRIHPPTPLSLPHIAEESCEIFGYHIPKNSTILINVWAIGRDPKEWSNPLVFKPERFLPGNEKDGVDVKGNNFELIPFGSGRRICVGLNLGIKVVQLVVATLVHAFDWELENQLDPENLNMDEVFALTLQRAVPLSVHPRPRLSQHVYSSLSSSL